MLDGDGDEVVTLGELQTALRGCSDVASVLAKAQRPVFAVPPLPSSVFVGYLKDVTFVAVTAHVEEFNVSARWDATAPDQQMVEEPDMSSTAEAAVEVSSAVDTAMSNDRKPDIHQRVLAVTGGKGCGKSRMLLEVVHSLHTARPTLFSGGTVFVSVEDMQLSAAGLFTALCGAVGMTGTGDDVHIVFQRWCSRQSRRGNVLLVVDGGRSEVWDVANLLRDCLYDNYDGTWDTLSTDSARKLRQRPNRVFLLVAGSMSKPPVMTAVAATPRVLVNLQGLQRDDARLLAERVSGEKLVEHVSQMLKQAGDRVSPRVVYAMAAGLRANGAYHEAMAPACGLAVSWMTGR
jgi:hypothetical protein